MSKLQEQAEKLADRPYTVITFRDKTTDDEYIYLARNPELDGCLAQGETMREAQENLRDVRIDYIEHLLEHGLTVPEPEYSATKTGSKTVLDDLDQIPPLDDERIEPLLETIIQPDNREQLYEASIRPLA